MNLRSGSVTSMVDGGIMCIMLVGRPVLFELTEKPALEQGLNCSLFPVSTQVLWSQCVIQDPLSKYKLAPLTQRQEEKNSKTAQEQSHRC